MKKILILLICLIITGCFNYQELNNYAIVTGIAIDKKEDNYEVSVMIANGTKDNDNKTNISIVSGYGDNIYSAIKDISLAVPKELYISHLNVIIISEDIAKQGLTPILDFLVRDPESHQSFYLAIAKDNKAKDILGILDPIADYPSQNISANLKSSTKLQSRISNDKFNQFSGKLLEKGVNPILNSLIIYGDKNKGINTEEQNNTILKNYVKLDTISIFKDDKLVDYANDLESIGINILLNKIDEIYINISYKGNIILSSNNLITKTKVNKDSVNIDIKTDVKINEIESNIKLDNNTIKEIEQLARDKIKEYVDSAIILAKENKTDIFGYGTRLYKFNPNYFNKIDNWDEYFTKLKFNINIEVNIKDKGSANDSIGVIKE